jgi:hypothetical protein
VKDQQTELNLELEKRSAVETRQGGYVIDGDISEQGRADCAIR